MSPHTWLRPSPDAPPTPDSVLAAANRVAHMNYPDTNSNGQTLDALIADAQVLAGAVLKEATG